MDPLRLELAKPYIDLKAIDQTSRLRFLFLVTEIAVSVVLLVGAGLLVKSFQNVMHEQPGFNPANLLTVTVPFNPAKTDKPEKRLQHMRELLERLNALPGVKSASLVNRLPLTGDSEIRTIRPLGRPLPKSAEDVSGEYRVIDPAYFRTMQIPVVAGRELRADDSTSSAVINQRMARVLWLGENPLGRQFTDGDDPPFTVIGVVGDVHNASLERPVMMQFYRQLAADPYGAETFVIRSVQEPESLISLVQKTVAQLDATEPVTHAQTMEHIFAAVTLQRRFETGLVSGFATVALFLSALGLFGVASLSAARRTREFGIRLAVGATTGQILRLELVRNGTTVLLGLFIGLVASFSLTRAMTGLLYGVIPWDAEIFAAASLVLVIAAMLAGWAPARRAARIDPATALRIE